MARPAQKLLLSLGVIAAVLCVALVVGLAMLRHYIQSDAFRYKVEDQIGGTLRGDVTLEPLSYSAGTLRTSSFTAQGSAGTAFNEMKLQPVRADVSFGRIAQGIISIDRVETELGVLDFQSHAVNSPPKLIVIRSRSSGGYTARPVSSSSSGLKVEVQAAAVQHATIKWDGGRAAEVAVEATREGEEWAIRGSGGQLEHAGWPALSIDSVRLRQHGERLSVERAELHQGATGTVVVDGEVQLQKTLELKAKLDRISVEPLLAPDWKKRLTGNLNGAVQMKRLLSAVATPELSGSLSLTDGKLEALPVLNELATFTQLAQFRTIALSRVQGDFRQREGRLSVSKLVAESSGLMRIEGAFVVEGDQIKGDFQVGLAPNTLQWLPGARTKLFAATRDGYCWAPMHLEGPVASPREDLSPRLIAAVAEGTIEGTVESLRKAGESLPTQVPETAKKLLDIFLGK